MNLRGWVSKSGSRDGLDAQATRLLSAELGRDIAVRPAMVIYGPTVPWAVARLRGLPGYQFKLTGGMYTRPNGKNLQRFPDSKPTDDWGVIPHPDYTIKLTPTERSELVSVHLIELGIRSATERRELEWAISDAPAR